jgi:aryl-alcohol dehydrogenase-like predicted oxidoreductase
VGLYQIHRFDFETPIRNTGSAERLRAGGKVRYLGGSAMFAWQFMKMLMTSGCAAAGALCQHSVTTICSIAKMSWGVASAAPKCCRDPA